MCFSRYFIVFMLRNGFIIFRYCKNYSLEKKVYYNDKLMYITNSNGLITFSTEENNIIIISKIILIFMSD